MLKINHIQNNSRIRVRVGKFIDISYYLIEVDMYDRYSSLYNSFKNGPLAQLVEQETLNLLVIGSNPIRPTNKIK